MNTVSEQQARLALFSVIEGGQIYWSNQIREFGSQDVYGRLLDETYDPVKFRKLTDRLKAVDLGLLEEQIEKSGAQFITPESANWPPSLNDLNAAPIGLVVKGDLSMLSERSLAIVGTRNPTPYDHRLPIERKAEA